MAEWCVLLHWTTNCHLVEVPVPVPQPESTEQDHFGQRISLLFAHQCAVCVCVFVVDHITTSPQQLCVKRNCAVIIVNGYVTFRHSSTRESSKVCMLWFAQSTEFKCFLSRGYIISGWPITDNGLGAGLFLRRDVQTFESLWPEDTTGTQGCHWPFERRYFRGLWWWVFREVMWPLSIPYVPCLNKMFHPTLKFELDHAGHNLSRAQSSKMAIEAAIRYHQQHKDANSSVSKSVLNFWPQGGYAGQTSTDNSSHFLWARRSHGPELADQRQDFARLIAEGAEPPSIAVDDSSSSRGISSCYYGGSG